MTKLDEIEANLQIVHTFMLGIPAQKHIEDDRLLIRAVRQLGALAKDEIEDRLDRGFHLPVDSDVLELFEE